MGEWSDAGCAHVSGRPGGVTRRSLLFGAAAGLAATSGLAGAGPAAAAQKAKSGGAAAGKVAPLPGAPAWKHAVGDPRGIDIAVTSGRNAEARYGLMFKSLPAYAPPDDLLTELAEGMVEVREPLSDVRLSNDGYDHPDVPAGYVYLGQFIDHDMTRDETPLSQQQMDPKGLTNFDTPFFDLGSVYGRGPALDPQLYDAAVPGKLLLQEHDGVLDVPRAADGTAMLGDPRNDENLIILQLQIAFIRLHNEFLSQTGDFEVARRLTRWHFQWVIVNDFLPRMVGEDVLEQLVVHNPSGPVRVRSSFYRPANPLRPMMPIEFSAAAYRFGHSMIRAEYEVRDVRTPEGPEGAEGPEDEFDGDNEVETEQEPEAEDESGNESGEKSLTFPIFSSTGPDLRGSRPLPAEMCLDWNYFFEIPGLGPPDDRNMARLIDTQVARPLHDLPDSVVAHTPGAVLALAERNLLRGKRLGLPAGQDVAKAMRLPVLSNVELGLTDRRWGGKAPLWFYVLREAERGGGLRLGPVGGRIVADVILGLLAADRSSYFNSTTGFTPVVPDCRMGDLLQMARAI